MQTFTCLLAFCLAAAPRPLQADEAPVVFARSGQKATLPVGGEHGKTGTPVAIWAFGQRWGEPATVKDDAVEFVAPEVRVPVVFRLSPVSDAGAVLGELVVYPDRPISWDEKILLYAADPPPWFVQWAAVTGLPVRPVVFHEDLPSESDATSLLILGRNTAGTYMLDAAKLARNKAVNVLVLDADWFGDAAGPAAVGGGWMRGDLLARTGKQSWAAMLEFRSHRQPTRAPANRWVWIPDKANLPLVEKLVVVGTPLNAVRCVVASYLPWQEQLGRQETADATLLDLLAAAANTSGDVVSRSVDVIRPKMDEQTARQRPVLSAAASAAIAWKDRPWSAYVLDLRGDERLSDELLPALKRLEKQIGAKTNVLLILGDDRLLDEWEWLSLDRAKKAVRRQGVFWLSDDELPPSTESQIRIMLTLSELGVPIVPPAEQEKLK